MLLEKYMAQGPGPRPIAGTKHRRDEGDGVCMVEELHGRLQPPVPIMRRDTISYNIPFEQLL